MIDFFGVVIGLAFPCLPAFEFAKTYWQTEHGIATSLTIKGIFQIVCLVMETVVIINWLAEKIQSPNVWIATGLLAIIYLFLSVMILSQIWKLSVDEANKKINGDEV
jgi:hypothetical protein